jgi:hypothetical protein
MKAKQPTKAAAQAVAEECKCSEADAGYFLSLVAQGFDPEAAALRAGLDAPPKSKGGRPPAPPGLRRVNVPLRLPEWLVQWMAEQPDTPAELIEAALLKAHKLRPPRAP